MCCILRRRILRVGTVAAMDELARRMFELVEPIGVIPYSADEPNEAMFALGFTKYWDTYFAGRAAALGTSVPAEVVHALFYNFAPGEVARHIPGVWGTTRPLLARRPGRGAPPHPGCLGHHYAPCRDRRSAAGLREGAAPDPGRAHRNAWVRPRGRAPDRRGHQRSARRSADVRRPANT